MASAWSKLTVSMGLDTTGFQAGMSKAGGMVQRWGRGLTGQLAGAFSAGAVLVAMRQIVQRGREVRQLSEDLGMGSKAIYDMGNAAEIAGVSFESMDTMLMRVMKTLGSAEGQQKMEKLFNAMGKSFEDISTLQPAEQIERMMAALGAAPMTPGLVFALNELAGRGASKLQDIAETLKEVSNLPFSQFDPTKLEAFDKAIKRTAISAKSMLGTIALGFQSMFETASETLRSKDKKTVQEWAGFVLSGLSRRMGPALDVKLGTRRSRQATPEETEAQMEKDKKDLEEIIKLNERLEDIKFKNSIKSLGDGQRDVEIKKKIHALTQDAMTLEAESGRSAESVKLWTMIEELKGLMQASAAGPESLTKQLFNADQLARIGGTINSSGMHQSWRGDLRTIRDMLMRKGIKVYGEL